jgi:hypothetical protein
MHTNLSSVSFTARVTIVPGVKCGIVSWHIVLGVEEIYIKPIFSQYTTYVVVYDKFHTCQELKCPSYREVTRHMGADMEVCRTHTHHLECQLSRLYDLIIPDSRIIKTLPQHCSRASVTVVYRGASVISTRRCSACSHSMSGLERIPQRGQVVFALVVRQFVVAERHQ